MTAASAISFNALRVHPPTSSAEPITTSSPDEQARALSRAIVGGDKHALERLYREWFDRWLGAARAITRRDDTFCLDIVQEATLRVVRSIRPMSCAQELDGWMLRVLRSAALDSLRTERRRCLREAVAEERRRGVSSDQDASAAASSTMELNERITWLERELATTPEQTNALLRLRLAHDATLEQTGEATAMTGPAAHGKIRRWIDRLRTKATEVFHE